MWTVKGSGLFGGASDAFHYVWRDLSGDGTVHALLTTPQSGNHVGACVIMRQDADPAAAYYAICHNPIADTVDIFYRATRGAVTTGLASLSRQSLPLYVGIARAGDTFTAYTSSDGTTWAPFNGTTATLQGLGSAIKAGIAVVSDDDGNGALDSATFDHVAVAPGGYPAT